MSHAINATRTPAGAMLGRLVLNPDRARAQALLVFAGSLLLIACAYIRFPLPFTPVPVTMQTFGVLVIGAALGLRLGLSAVALYIAYGFVGLPVFAGSTVGLAALTGATGGYLVGFLLAAALCGFATDRGWTRSFKGAIGVMTHATALIFIPGVLWLNAVAPGGFEAALVAGLWPFLPGAVVKIALAATALPMAWRLVGRSDID